ncbi:MAG: PD-(D/E)XK nuclease family protein, partial [Thermoguttaceae bacterium]|nr:PD-(D/E)XK nuclease family protein [Thermoguttaceae bacterium]
GAPKRDRETESQIEGFFKRFNKALSSLAEIPDELSEKASGAEAIRVVLKQLANERIDPTPESEVVEMQGWLDLLFDDAPNLILTGFNEGTIPTNKSSDLFLPNDTRTQVGLSDSQRLYARDAYLTSALANSRRNMFVVMGRRSLDGDPRLPSRFVFATDREEIPRRVVKYFAQGDSDVLRRLRARQLDADGRVREFPRKLEIKDVDSETDSSTGDAEIDALNAKSAELMREQTRFATKGFRAPTLDVRAQQAKKSRYNLGSINVTDFQTFLDSPYRFFLRKVFGLVAAPPPNTYELDAGKFGTVVHDVLRIFGESELKDSTDEHVIAQKLGDWLDEYAKSFVNDHTSPFVKVQIEQIRDRLRAFARWQAAWRKSGRVIKWVERAPEEQRISCRVGEKEFWINGRIDRIDYCPAENRWYLFDYKTFDKATAGKTKEKPQASQSIADDVCVRTETGEATLFSSRVGNAVDAKHRAKVKEGEPSAARFLAKLGINLAADDSDSGSYDWRWTNLQLPLYRRLFWQIIYEDKEGAVPK